jgi:hypothetical protein
LLIWLISKAKQSISYRITLFCIYPISERTMVITITHVEPRRSTILRDEDEKMVMAMTFAGSLGGIWGVSLKGNEWDSYQFPCRNTFIKNSFHSLLKSLYRQDE